MYTSLWLHFYLELKRKLETFNMKGQRIPTFNLSTRKSKLCMTRITDLTSISGISDVIADIEKNMTNNSFLQ